MSDQTTSGSGQDALPQPPAETRQFDFWLGEWDLSWGEGLRATNRIERVMDGRVILESFDGQPGTPLKGMSVSTFDAAAGRWRQTWVDNAGGYLDFVGGMAGEQMILSREAHIDGKPVRQRMVWLNIGPDSLDWHWDRSEDGGQSWQTLWALHYIRKQQGRD